MIRGWERYEGHTELLHELQGSLELVGVAAYTVPHQHNSKKVR